MVTERSKYHGSWKEIKTRIELQGGPEERTEKLKEQLKTIPNTIESLYVGGDTPTDQEWSELGGYFSHIKNLELEAGYNESLNDGPLPLHWPLERLIISSSCGEVCTSPWIIHGKLKHLVLLYTCSLRFEGPTTGELCEVDKQEKALQKAEEEAKRTQETQASGTEPDSAESKLNIVFIPELAQNWLESKYSQPIIFPPQEAAPTFLSPIHLEHLDIFENDALDTFTRLCLACPHLVVNLKSLTLRSTQRCSEFFMTPEHMFPQFLSALDGLESLTLTLSNVFTDNNHLDTICTKFPKNLKELHFRGPSSLVKSPQWQDTWISSFADPKYLPNLERVSVMLDLEPIKGHQESIDQDLMQDAKISCSALEAVIAKRNKVNVEPFFDEWSEHLALSRQTDV